MVPALIQTGIDKLINIVKEQGRISVPRVAREIGVSKSVIEGWIKFLEDEDLISIEYKLTVPYIVYKELSKKDLLHKAREFKSKKESFISKASVSLSFIEKEGEKLKGAKGQFDRLKKELGMEIDKVRDELKELERYDKLKSELDQKMMEQKKGMEESLKEYDLKVNIEQKKYAEIIGSIDKEERRLVEEEKDALALEDQEKQLFTKLDSIKDVIKDIESKIKGKEDKAKKFREEIADLKEFADKIRNDVESKKKDLLPVVEESRRKAKDIEKMQDLIFEKISKQKRNLKDTQEVTDRFNKFFDQNLKVESLLTKINKDRDELEKKLKEVINKAQAFRITAKDKDVGKHVIELEKMFGEVEKKTSFFEEELRKLKSLFG